GAPAEIRAPDDGEELGRDGVAFGAARFASGAAAGALHLSEIGPRPRDREIARIRTGRRRGGPAVFATSHPDRPDNPRCTRPLRGPSRQMGSVRRGTGRRVGFAARSARSPEQSVGWNGRSLPVVVEALAALAAEEAAEDHPAQETGGGEARFLVFL